MKSVARNSAEDILVLLSSTPFKRDSGVCHGDDVLYIFPFEGLPPAVETEVIMLSYTASEHDI